MKYKLLLLLIISLSTVVYPKEHKLKIVSIKLPVFGLDLPTDNSDMILSLDGCPPKTQLDGISDMMYGNLIIGDIVENKFIVGIIGFNTEINDNDNFNLKLNLGTSTGIVVDNQIYTLSYTTQNGIGLNLLIKF